MFPDEYKEKAIECLRLAQTSENPAQKMALLEMAQSWLKLYDQAVKNSETDLVYETPPRRSVTQPMQQQQQRAKGDE